MDSVLLPALEQMLLFMPLCFGIYITYRIMRITDLTVQATFVLGAAVFARLVTAHYNEAIATLAGVSVGAVAGIIVAMMQKFAKLDALITSILAIFMLYSINFEVMGRPNISLLSTSTLLQSLQASSGTELFSALILLILIVAVLLLILFKSNFGLLLRTFGSNNRLLPLLAKNRLLLLALGLALSNGLAALSGIITAQINGYADINMGLGVALTAIGAMIVGITFVEHCRSENPQFNAVIEIASSCLGVFLYFMVMNLLLYFGLSPLLLKLVLGVILMLFLSSGRFNSREVAHV